MRDERNRDAVAEIAVGKTAETGCQGLDGLLDIGGFLGLQGFALAALLLGQRTAGLGFAFETGTFDGIGAEHGDGGGHRADLVAAFLAGNFGLEVAGSQAFHGTGHIGDRTDDEAAEQGCEEGDHHADGQKRGDGCGNPELADGGIGDVGIDSETDIPFDRRQACDRHEADQHRLAVKLGLHDRRTDRRRVDAGKHRRASWSPAWHRDERGSGRTC